MLPIAIALSTTGIIALFIGWSMALAASEVYTVKVREYSQDNQNYIDHTADFIDLEDAENFQKIHGGILTVKKY